MLWLFLIQAAAYAQTVTSVSPQVVTQRSSITVIGTGFTASSTVRFYTTTDNAATAGTTLYKLGTSVTVISPTELRVILPDVLAANTASTPLTFRVFNGALYSAPQAYTYVAPFSYASTSNITEVVTNWNNGSTTYWKSTSASSVASQQPDGSHSVMGFRYGGKLYSTGNESNITSVLNAAGYTTAGTTGTGTGYITGNFRALPIKTIQGAVPSTGPNLIVLGSRIDGSATTQVPTAPNVAGLSVRDVLIDGTRGLNIGTGVTNLPAVSVLTFEATNIVADGVADGVPDIIVSQVAEPTDGSFSVYSFTDTAGNIVGHPVQVAFSTSGVPVIGRYKSDFFTLPAGQPLNTAQVNGSLIIGANTRDIRMVAYKISDFGISTSNASLAKQFKVMPSGTSDPAFMAYNRNRFFIPAPEITGQPVSQAICPGGVATFSVTVASTSSGTENPEFQWEKNGVPLVNGGNISGVNSATLTISPINTADAGAYRCLITNAAGAALSNTAYLNTVITAGADVATCINTTATIEVSSLGNTPTYQWYSNTTNSNTGGTLIAGQTATTYNPPVATAGTFYYYAKSKPAGLSCASAEVASNPITFSVVSGAVGGEISPSQSVCPHGYATVTVSEYAGTSIQWQRATSSNGTYTDIPTSETTTATAPTLYIADAGATARFYRAKISSNCGQAFSPVSAVNVNNFYIWTGTVNTDWSLPGNWSCNIVPTITINVIIPAGAANQPSVFGITGLAKTVTVEADASLTVLAGGTLRVANAVNVETGATLLVNNNGALLQDSAVANTGNITVKRNSNPLYRLDYTFWSSPVQNQNVLAFSPNTLVPRFYEYRYGNATLNSGNTNLEQYFEVNPASSFKPGQSVLIRMPNWMDGAGINSNAYAFGTTPYAFAGSFTGVPNNGNIEPALLQNGYSQAGHFTGVGNPYPSPVSIQAFFQDADNMLRLKSGSALYFWRKKNDSSVSSYAKITLSGFVANNVANQETSGGQEQAVYFNGGNVPVADWILSPGQGFLVSLAANAPGNAVFKNSMRRAAVPAGQPFFKTLQGAPVSRVWLNLNNTAGSYSQTLIAYSENGTLDVDYGYDGLDIAETGILRFYSRHEADNFGIQTRPQFTNTDVVAMGFQATVAGQYSVSLADKDGVFNTSQDVFVKDNLLGVIQSLKDQPYTFTTEAGTFNNRLEVIYAPQTLDAATPELALNNVLVYKKEGSNSINIVSGSLEMKAVNIYDIRGRKLYAKENVNANETIIADLNIQQQVIIVEVITTGGKVSKKLIY